MEFVDLKKHYLSIKDEIDTAIARVLESGQYVLGDEVSAFENEIAKYSGTQHAIGVNSGADALFLALESLGVGAGDEVIVPPFTMAASGEAVARLGAVPVFADILPATFNIDPKRVEEVVTARTKAIIPVHLFGQSADMTALMGIAKKHQLLVVEDACQSIGARWGGDKVGSIGNAGALSFFPSKNLGGFGDGGMVVTSTPKVDEGVRLRRAHGAKKKYFHEVHGINSRLDPIQAAVLRVKLAHLDSWTTRRREIAAVYDEELRGVGDIVLPFALPEAFHVYHQYTIRTAERDALKEYLVKNGIPSVQYYPYPLHILPIFEQNRYKNGDMPEAERACDEVLSIPIDPLMSNSEQELVIKTVKSFFAK